MEGSNAQGIAALAGIAGLIVINLFTCLRKVKRSKCFGSTIEMTTKTPSPSAANSIAVDLP